MISACIRGNFHSYYFEVNLKTLEHDIFLFFYTLFVKLFLALAQNNEAPSE